jgi:hypothetical protein
LAEPADPGMPGGDFWYLPLLESEGDVPQLRLPLAGVLDWLEDLLGQPVHKATPTWPDSRVDVESVKRSLAKWRVGDIPRRENIERYFAEGTPFEFRGCLEIAKEASHDQALEEVQTFMERKGLTADALRLQIPMTAPGKIEAVLAGNASRDHVDVFLALIQARYAKPSLRTIRRCLLTARVTQFAYVRISQWLCPEASIKETDSKQNKVLQLVDIYGHIYNLTLRANCASEDWRIQDVWFEQRLAPWDKKDLFLSILPSKRPNAAFELAEELSWRFCALEPGAPLDDWAIAKTKDLPEFAQRKRNIIARELTELEAYDTLTLGLQSGPIEIELSRSSSYKAVSRVATDERIQPNIRHAAIQRMRELATTSAQDLDSILIELNIFLSSNHEMVATDTREAVERLFKEVDENTARLRRQPQILSAKAKHFVRANEFSQARRCFKEALEACLSDSCGHLQGLIARDAFALDTAIKPNGFGVANYERHWRLMLNFEVITGPEHNLEAIAKELEAYFWEDFYHPYPGIDRWNQQVQ